MTDLGGQRYEIIVIAALHKLVYSSGNIFQCLDKKYLRWCIEK